MKKSGFTFVEILFVLILLGTLSALGVKSFKRARDAHRIDILVQELTLLRTAILSYKEVHGTLPAIEESELSSSNFNALKSYWYPFHPENSKIIEGAKWYGKISTDATQSFFALKKGGSYVAFDKDLLGEKLQGLCDIDDSYSLFYFLEAYGSH